MRNLYIIFTLLCSTNLSIAQNINIGETINIGALTDKMYIGENKNYYYLSSKNNSITISKNKIIKVNKSTKNVLIKKFTVKTSGKVMNEINNLVLFNNTLIVNYYNYLNQKIEIKFYDINTLKEIKNKSLNNINSEKGLTIKLSNNKLKCALIDNSNSYTIILNENLDIIANYKLIPSSNYSLYLLNDNLILDDDGNLYIAGRKQKYIERTPAHTHITRTNNYIFKYDLEGNSIEKELILGDEITTENYKITIDDFENIFISGYYKQKESYDTKGVFNMIYTSDLSKRISYDEQEFEQDFMKLRWQGHIEKKIKGTNKKPNYYENNIIKIININNNEKITIGEQSFSLYKTITTPGTATSRFSQNNSSTSSLYYFKDIRITKSDRLGNIIWTKKIEKKQYAKDYINKILISHLSYYSNNKIYFLFNDNKLNKTNEAIYKSNFKIYNYGDIGTFLVELDLSTGKMTKSLLFTFDKTKQMLIASPNIDDKKHFTFLLFKNNKFSISNLN